MVKKIHVFGEFCATTQSDEAFFRQLVFSFTYIDWKTAFQLVLHYNLNNNVIYRESLWGISVNFRILVLCQKTKHYAGNHVSDESNLAHRLEYKGEIHYSAVLERGNMATRQTVIFHDRLLRVSKLLNILQYPDIPSAIKPTKRVQETSRGDYAANVTNVCIMNNSDTVKVLHTSYCVCIHNPIPISLTCIHK